MNYSLSDNDINTYFNHKVKVLSYKDIYNYNSIDSLLHPYNFVIILYEMTPGNGHWCLFFKRNNKVCEFFDPYGIKIDDQIKWVDDFYKFQLGENYRYLSSLILYSKYNLEYNPYQFQKYSKNINTCGRWCILRYLFKKLSIDKFHKMIKSLSKKFKLSFDNLVTFLVSIN